MCGLAGVWSYSKTNEDIDEYKIIVKKMLMQILYRGPDHQGLWISQKDGLCLGHNRLKILDTSDAGNQPMTSHCGRYIIAFNGEVYNFLDLRKKLESKGVKFKSKCDTEILIEAFARFRHSIWNQLDGMFAVAIYDTFKKEMLLARDRFGEKPLYWTLQNNMLHFCSELKPLILSHRLSIRIDKNSLVKYLLFRYVPAPSSMFKDIYKLRPGSYILIDKDGKCIEKEWYSHSLEPFEGKLSQKHFEENCDFVESALIESLERRLFADVPVGLFLSAGLDSSLVAVLCSKVLGKQLKAFTYGTSNDNQTEHKAANKIANSLGHEFNYKISDNTELINTAMTCGHMLDEPVADRGIISQRIISRFAKEEVTVCLSGDGGDELFGGYDRYLKAKLHQYHHQNNFTDSFAYEYFDKLLPVYQIKDLLDIFPDNSNTLRNSIKDFYPMCLDPSLKGAVHTMRHIDLESYLPDCVLTKVDRCTMESSLESRTPFLNRKVMSICKSLPSEYCVETKSGKQKLILRKILSKYLSKEDQMILLDRKKQGFGVTKEIFIDNKNFLQKEVNKSAQILLESNTLCRDELKKISGCMKNNNSIWAFIVLGQWIQSLYSIKSTKREISQ